GPAVGHCPPPAVPPGAVATGAGRQRGAEVELRCGPGLLLVGSGRRRCLPSGEWSGAEASCRHPFSFDLPEDVRDGFGTSLSGVLGLAGAGAERDESLGRRIVLSRTGSLHVYFLIDASKSVNESNFRVFKDCVAAVVDRISSFEVPVSFAVISYASQARVIVSTTHDEASDADEVLSKVEAMKFGDHGDATGTNIHGALMEVYHMILFQRERAAQQGQPEAWRSVRHAVLLLTDGKFNVGGHPSDAVAKIEDVLEIKPDRADYLDVYAFGVGAMEVDWLDLDAIASKKPGETHAFKLADTAALRLALENVLEGAELGDICGLANASASATGPQQNPWHVVLRAGVGQTCSGSLVARRWVLTAAHCFTGVESTDTWTVDVGGGEWVPIRRWLQHEGYDVRAGVARGIPEFYDYDVALVELERDVGPAGTPRRICLPCTEDANRALKMPLGTTCKEQEAELLGRARVPAQFVSLETQRTSVLIKTQEEWEACAAGAVQPGTVYAGASVSDVVTERFLCSGGRDEGATCKGESGGALFLERKHRFVQVGVVSWGTFEACRGRRGGAGKQLRARPPPGHRPRDFHISLFRVQPWLRRLLGGQLRFAPLG
ncbi:complement C2-like, partial [Struthio camelus]|uniref:complement C2-like n=1 Tax=Struthio camelus TaxID=8801 RepID=UPI003603AFB1